MSDEMLRRIARNVGMVRVMGKGQPRPADRFPSTKPSPIATRSEPTFGTLGTEEWAVLLCLANFYNEREQRTFVGVPTIARDTGLNSGSIQRAIRWLIARGLVTERGKRRSDNGRDVNTYGLNIPDDDLTRRRVTSPDASGDASDDASGDASGDASHHSQPATMLAEQNRTEPNPGCWELGRCIALDLERDPPNAIRSSRENLERKIAGDYAPIIRAERKRRTERGLPLIEVDDELAHLWVEYLVSRRKPELVRLPLADRELLFPTPPCPHGCRNGWLEPAPSDPEQRMIPCPTCRK